jgi:hypothetical protein
MILIVGCLGRFGTIPPGVRSYVGAALAVAASEPSAGSGGDFITFNGDTVTQVFVHEAAHSLDQGTNALSSWQNAIAQSSCVCVTVYTPRPIVVESYMRR